LSVTSRERARVAPKVSANARLEDTVETFVLPTISRSAAARKRRPLLFNAIRFGPHSQNRDNHPAFRAHLEGLVAWAGSINPIRGRRLWALFDRIRWDEPGTTAPAPAPDP
jgi:hypothetical protein